MTVNIAIIDQNEIYRESLSTLLSQIKDFGVVLVTGDGNCLKKSLNIPIHALLLDNCFRKEKCSELVRETREKWESAKILILAMYREELIPESGIADFILKSSDKKEFEERIRRLVTPDRILHQAS